MTNSKKLENNKLNQFLFPKKLKIQQLEEEKETLRSNYETLQEEQEEKNELLEQFQDNELAVKREQKANYQATLNAQKSYTDNLNIKTNQHAENLQKMHKSYERNLEEVLAKQDIGNVLQTITKTTNDTYLSALAEGLQTIQAKAKNHEPEDTFNYLTFSGTLMHNPNIDAHITYKAMRTESKVPSTKAIKTHSKKFTDAPQTMLQNSTYMRGEQFRRTETFNILTKEFKDYEGSDLKPSDIKPKDHILVSTMQEKTKFGDTLDNEPHTTVYQIKVTAEEENTYGKMLNQDIPSAIKALAIGSIQNAIDQRQYGVVKTIAEQYLTQKEGPVLAPILGKAIENNSVAAGYLNDIVLKE